MCVCVCVVNHPCSQHMVWVCTLVTTSFKHAHRAQVRDLFAKAGSGPSGGLKVRMNPKSGVEVVGLTEWPVASYQEIEERIDTATRSFASCCLM